MTTYLKPDFNEYPILSGHEALLQLLGDRSHYLNKWLGHVHADPDIHTIIQFPVPGRKFVSHYFLVEKKRAKMITEAFGNGAIEAADYLARCPNIIIEQSVAPVFGATVN